MPAAAPGVALQWLLWAAVETLRPCNHAPTHASPTLCLHRTEGRRVTVFLTLVIGIHSNQTYAALALSRRRYCLAAGTRGCAVPSPSSTNHGAKALPRKLCWYACTALSCCLLGHLTVLLSARACALCGASAGLARTCSGSSARARKEGGREEQCCLSSCCTLRCRLCTAAVCALAASSVCVPRFPSHPVPGPRMLTRALFCALSPRFTPNQRPLNLHRRLPSPESARLPDLRPHRQCHSPFVQRLRPLC